MAADNGCGIHGVLQGGHHKDPCALAVRLIRFGSLRPVCVCAFRRVIRLYPPEQVEDIVRRASRIFAKRVVFVSVFGNRGGKPGEAGVKLLGILHLGNNQDNALRV